MNNANNIKEIITNAGLRVAEAARAMRVSRGTLYNRMNGTPARMDLVKDVNDRVVFLIEKATNAGKFPPPYELTGKERYAYIQRVLNEMRTA